jgi:hypothetical protein
MSGSPRAVGALQDRKRVAMARVDQVATQACFLGSVPHAGVPGALGAMGAAKDLIAGFHAMADDLATATRARRGQGMDGALKAAKGMGFYHPT